MNSELVGWSFVGVPVLIGLYAYIGYPLALATVVRIGQWRGEERHGPATDTGTDWPSVTILVPAYNEADQIRSKLENVLELDYPHDRLHVLVVSDASTDGTDEIVRDLRDRGVQLVRLEQRSGKSAAENAARAYIRGDIVVTTDAGVRIAPDGLRPLIRAFAGSDVGVAAGRDVSVPDSEEEVGPGEAGYVGYEMWVRDLETRLGTIVGAGGSYYAARRSVFMQEVPEEFSRDFAAALVARLQGLRSVSVSAARCRIPPSGSLRAEFRRKVRTMARGLRTLWHYRAVANPFRYGRFAVFLLSHKFARWVVYPAVLLVPVGLLFLGGDHPLTVGTALTAAIGGAVGGAALTWPDERSLPVPLAAAGYVLVAGAAGLQAWAEALAGAGHAVWEPTRRQTTDAS